MPDATAAREPVVEPAIAMMLGLMPLRSAGVDVFRAAQPRADGRGVLIAILDSGIDPGVAGLIATSAGAPKILDLRDFSREGRVALEPVTPPADPGGRLMIGGRAMAGAARVGRLTTAPVWYAGVFRELPLGPAPAGDVNGNGVNTDAFPLVVVRAPEGWTVFLDTNLDGSFEDEMPLHDYRQGRETIALGARPITLAANFSEAGGGGEGATRVPVLDLYFDTSGHGTHVAGIAAGHGMFNIRGFDGVAPGAQLLGLKIANNARGGVSVHGSMMLAMDYAARFARQRNLPLVINLSFGVGNEREGRAVIDSIVDVFLGTHPDIVFAVSAGNDGPGISTVGFPGSADLALSVGATYPGVFARVPEPGVPPAPDVVGWFSARGGELAKPDIVTPGVVFSVVPPWETGDEIKGGTSMAAPYAAGLAACLISAFAQDGRALSAAEVLQALRVSGRRYAQGSAIDQGYGTPVLQRAHDWLKAGHQGSLYEIRAGTGASAAYRRNGLAHAGDTIETFTVRHRAGQRVARFLLRSDAAWLSAPRSVDAAPRGTAITVTYRRDSLAVPGIHVGTVTAWNPSDTAAGPIFRLVNTVIVPHDLQARPLLDERRSVPPAGVHRYFLRVPRPGSTLRATVTLADSLRQQATVRLYEPNGAPARSASVDIDIGGGEDDQSPPPPGTATVLVRGEDVVPGVYELDIVAPPLAATTVTVRAELGPVSLTRVTGGREARLEASGAVVGGQVVYRLVGAERAYPIAGRGEPAETLLVRAPDWARRVEVDFAVAPALWDELTDLSVTVYDSTGQQVPEANEAVNYAFGRLGFALPESLAGRPLVVEFYPAFARRTARPWRGDATIRLLGPDEPVGEGGELSVVAGGRMLVPLPRPPALAVPDGFAVLIETRVTTAAGAVAARRAPVAP